MNIFNKFKMYLMTFVTIFLGYFFIKYKRTTTHNEELQEDLKESRVQKETLKQVQDEFNQIREVQDEVRKSTKEQLSKTTPTRPTGSFGDIRLSNNRDSTGSKN